MSGNQIFGCAWTCGDGRLHDDSVVTDWATSNYGVNYLDRCTMPGLDMVFDPSLESKFDQPFGDPASGVSIGQRLQATIADFVIYVRAHNPKVIMVVGHTSCAGNPVDREHHISLMERSIEYVLAVGRKYDLGMENRAIHAFLASDETTGRWELEEIDSRLPEQTEQAAA